MSRRSSLLAVAAVILPACLALLGGAALGARAVAVPLSTLLRDTVAVLDAPFYTGLVSNVGILLWGACTTICLFVASVVRRDGRGTADARFFLAAAALSAWLLADDALLLHERVFPLYLGLPGRTSLLIGFAGMVLFGALFHRAIRQSDWPVLVAALTAFTASVVLDQLHDLHLLWRLGLHSGSVQILLEDGAKLVGIATWTGYFALTGRDRVFRDTARGGVPAARPEAAS